MELRPITDEEVVAYHASMLTTFGGDPAADAPGPERLRALLRIPGRAWGAFDRGQCVATAGTFEQTVSLPGGADLAMAGLTMVAVRPTHRRRGLLRAIIELHLADARAHGEPISGLWASESGIYGRFGYGVATEGDEITLDTRGVEVACAEPDEITDLADADAATLLPPVYDAVRAQRPGMVARSAAWWAWRRLRDRDDLRRGASPRRHVVARRGGQVTGWIASRQRPAWSEAGVAEGSYEIDELIAIDPRAEASLWRFASAIDLFPKLTYWNAPPDTLLPWLICDPRRARRLRTDAMWIRPDDVGAALAARRYAGDGRVRLALTEPGSPTFALEVEAGQARCATTGESAQLHLDRAALGSLLLSAFTPTLLARAGRLTADPAVLALAERMFAWPTPPWATEIF